MMREGNRGSKRENSDRFIDRKREKEKKRERERENGEMRAGRRDLFECNGNADLPLFRFIRY